MSDQLTDYEILESEREWLWYKRKLDADRKYEFRHDGGEPTQYPCGVISVGGDDPNGPMYYSHSFVYQQEVVCSECGHKTKAWPNQVAG